MSTEVQAREGQTFAGASLAARYASLVKLPHTLFALPFAGVGVVLASHVAAERITPLLAFRVVLAFTAARFAAMGFNRIVDRRYDALNPRTARRELPTGRLTVAQAAIAVAVSAAIFIYAAWQLNPLCGRLAPLALTWVFFYSYTKRFTAWSHHVLGVALGIAPAGGYLAVTGAWPAPWIALPVLSAAVMFWVAGFDVIYAIQDTDFDRAQGLHSIPARVGARRALARARIFHLVAFVLFGAVPLLDLFDVGPVFLIGVLCVAALLVYEHRAIGDAAPDTLDLPRLDRAFFLANVGVSTSFFMFTLLDRLL